MRHQTSKLVQDGLFREAMSLHSQLHSASAPIHKFTFPPLLKACAKLKSPLQGQILHAHVIKTGFSSQIYTATALANMYMKLNFLCNALKVFGEMPNRNLASLNAAISGFSQNGFSKEALLVFREVGFCGFRPNSVTIASLLPACDSAQLCLQVHCWAVKLGVEFDIFVATSLLSVYSNSGEIVLATRVFEEAPNKSVVCYNAFLSGLLQNGLPIMVLNVFKDMRHWSSEKPSSVTLVSVISACAGLLYLRFGKQVHGLIMKMELGYDTMVGTAIVDMYSKCGCWPLAYKLFNEMNGKRNLITWNAMIAGMMLNGQSDNAVELFERLKTEGLEPDSATWNSIISGFAQLEKGIEAFRFFKKMQSFDIFPSLKSVTSLLPACASLCAVQCGKEIHGHTIRTDINTDEFLATSLIDMYMKCGYSSSARIIFDHFEIKPKDPAFWNAMISGYGRNGEDETAIEIFDEMLEKQIKPNSATFTSVLSMCSHLGQVDKGWEVFRMMTRDYGLDPNPEQFGCMVDLFGRSGKLDEARKLIEGVSDPPASVFASLLGSCVHHLHFELGEEMAMKLSDLKPEDPSPLVILSNIYAGVGRWDDAERIRDMINARELRKLPGYSSIAVT